MKQKIRERKGGKERLKFSSQKQQPSWRRTEHRLLGLQTKGKVHAHMPLIHKLFIKTF